MPLIKVTTSAECSAEQKADLTLKMSRICAEGIGKPEMYVAAVVETGAAISYGGELQAGAFVDVKSIGGLNGSVNNSLSAAICDCLQESLGIPGNAVYINFTDIPASDWGLNGSTFG